MVFDTHTHTAFSTDSKMRLEEALRHAEALGIGVVTTEHMDLNYPEEGKFAFDVEEYFSAYQKYRGAQFLLGIEIGMAESCAGKNRAVAQSGGFDYVLGSIHTICDMDIYYDAYYSGKDKRQAYEAYFKAMRDCIASHPYIDALGHIDYIARYAKYSDTEIYYDDFSEAIDEVLKQAVACDVAMEVNTRRFDQGQAAKILLPIYRRYWELGGKMATIGSDAHRAGQIGAYFKEAMELACACGLEPVYFENRRAKRMR